MGKDVKCQRVLQEIIATENDFVQDLILLQTIYEKPMREKCGFLTDLDLKTVFGNLEDLVAFQTAFLHELEAAQATREIAQVFVDAQEDLKIFAVYCANSEARTQRVNKLLESKKFLKFITWWETEFQGDMADAVAARHMVRGRFELPQMLLKPVQRVLKYPLLLREVEAATSSHAEEMNTIKRAVGVVGDVAKHINELTRLTVNETDTSGNGLSRRRTAKSVRLLADRLGKGISEKLKLEDIEEDIAKTLYIKIICIEATDTTDRIVSDCVVTDCSNHGRHVEVCTSLITPCLKGTRVEHIHSFVFSVLRGHVILGDSKEGKGALELILRADSSQVWFSDTCKDHPLASPGDKMDHAIKLYIYRPFDEKRDPWSECEVVTWAVVPKNKMMRAQLLEALRRVGCRERYSELPQKRALQRLKRFVGLWRLYNYLNTLRTFAPLKLIDAPLWPECHKTFARGDKHMFRLWKRNRGLTIMKRLADDTRQQIRMKIHASYEFGSKLAYANSVRMPFVADRATVMNSEDLKTFIASLNENGQPQCVRYTATVKTFGFFLGFSRGRDVILLLTDVNIYLVTASFKVRECIALEDVEYVITSCGFDCAVTIHRPIAKGGDVCLATASAPLSVELMTYLTFPHKSAPAVQAKLSNVDQVIFVTKSMPRHYGIEYRAVSNSLARAHIQTQSVLRKMDRWLLSFESPRNTKDVAAAQELTKQYQAIIGRHNENLNKRKLLRDNQRKQQPLEGKKKRQSLGSKFSSIRSGQSLGSGARSAVSVGSLGQEDRGTPAAKSDASHALSNGGSKENVRKYSTADVANIPPV